MFSYIILVVFQLDVYDSSRNYEAPAWLVLNLEWVSKQKRIENNEIWSSKFNVSNIRTQYSLKKTLPSLF